MDGLSVLTAYQFANYFLKLDSFNLRKKEAIRDNTLHMAGRICMGNAVTQQKKADQAGQLPDRRLSASMVPTIDNHMVLHRTRSCNIGTQHVVSFACHEHPVTPGSRRRFARLRRHFIRGYDGNISDLRK